MLYKKILLSIISLFGTIVLSELFLYIIGFSYYPYNAYDLSNVSTQLFNKFGNEYRAGPLNIIGEQSFQTSKNSNTYRVVILGGSSIYNLGPAEIIKSKVQNITKKEIEIINAGLLGEGTNTLLKALPELLLYQPDLLVIYTGHNEFLSTYIKETYQKMNMIEPFNNLYKYSRIFQLASFISDKTVSVFYRTNVRNQHKLDLHLLNRVEIGVPYDKEYRNQIYENYRNNLVKMVSLANVSNIPVILSTVAYNRRAMPWHYTNNSPFLSNFNECNSLYEENKYQDAKICFENVIGNDTFPVRTTNAQNEIVKEVAYITKTPLADVDTVIVNASPHQIPDYNLFNDHCHLNTKGNELLQVTIADMIIKSILDTNR